MIAITSPRTRPRVQANERQLQLERLIRIAQAIQRRRFGISDEQLRQEVSDETGHDWNPRTVYRDLQLLERLGLVDVSGCGSTRRSCWIGAGGFLELPATPQSRVDAAAVAKALRLEADLLAARRDAAALRATLQEKRQVAERERHLRFSQMSRINILAARVSRLEARRRVLVSRLWKLRAGRGTGHDGLAALPMFPRCSPVVRPVAAAGIADCLRQVIRESGLSANAIAKACGVPQNCLSRFIRGGDLSLPSFDRVVSYFGLVLSQRGPSV